MIFLGWHNDSALETGVESLASDTLIGYENLDTPLSRFGLGFDCQFSEAR